MQNEVEIDLLDLGKKLLLKWKQIIIITIVIAAVFTGYRYMQSVRSYQASLAAQQENEDADTITKNAQAAYDALSEEEQSTVRTALRLREEIEADQEYMEAALLMQIDPYEESVVTIQYQIADVEEDEMIGKTLEKAYLNYLNSAGYQDEVVTQLDWDEDAQYICELISATSNATNAVVENSSTDDETNYYNNIINLDSSDAFFAVTVKGVDSESAEELATALQQVVNNYAAVLNEKIGTHTLSCIESYTTTAVDKELKTQIDTISSTIRDNQDSLSDLLDAFSDEQTSAYEQLLAADDAVVSDSTEVASADATTSSDSELTKPALSKRDILLGIMAGLFLGCAIYAAIYILNGKVHTAEELRDGYGVSLIAKVGTSDRALHQEILLTNILIACEKESAKTLHIMTSIAMNDTDCQLLESVIHDLSTKGISAAMSEEILTNSDGLKEASAADAVIIVEKLEATKRQSFDGEVRFCNEMSIKCLGIVVFEDGK